MRGLAVVALVTGLAGGLAGTAQAGEPPAAGGTEAAPAKPPVKKPMVLERSMEEVLAERIAKRLVEMSPMADPGDVRARDAAAEKLGAYHELIDAANGRILWGGFHPEQGYDPRAYRLHDRSREDFYQLTELNPMVWAKLYLSTFMFPGPYTVRKEGNFTVLELEARFRGELDAGEYPYPFWHSPNKWTAYMNAEKVLLVFEPGRLVSAMRVSPDPLAVKQIKRPWDVNWTWTNEKGEVQPRVALFSYLFSKDNPHVASLGATYRALEEEFRSHECMTCHAPDNQSRINDLLLLNYPNQALIMRRTLVAVLEDNQMPPGDRDADEPAGIHDEKVRVDLIKLAKAFEAEADAAFAYERMRKREQ